MTSTPERHRLTGFTMVELLVAMAIVGLLLAVAVPAGSQLYQSMQYRQAVKQVVTQLNSARQLAVNTGRTQDVSLDPYRGVVSLAGENRSLPSGVKLAMRTAREINRGDVGVIRFYPEGGSSGGDIDIESPSGSGVKISVDWLVGRVTQARYDAP